MSACALNGQTRKCQHERSPEITDGRLSRMGGGGGGGAAGGGIAHFSGWLPTPSSGAPPISRGGVRGCSFIRWPWRTPHRCHPRPFQAGPRQVSVVLQRALPGAQAQPTTASTGTPQTQGRSANPQGRAQQHGFDRERRLQDHPDSRKADAAKTADQLSRLPATAELAAAELAAATDPLDC